MIIVGLTGGIACGKSTVSKTLLANGIPVIDADIVARQVVEPGTSGLDKVIEHFGKQFLDLDGTLNRPALGLMVFSKPDAMAELNKIMGPLIEEEARNQFNKLSEQGHMIAVWDAALIVENGNYERYRPLIVVNCPQAVQVERLMKRNGLTERQAMDRISAQLPASEKVKVADYVIDTSGSIEESINQTEVIIKELKDRFGL